MNSSRFHRFLLATCLALLPAIAAAHPDPTPTPTPTPSPPLTGSLTLKTRTDTGQDGAGGTAAVLPPVPADLTRITIGTEINIAATPGSDFVFVRWESEPSGQVANSGKSQTSTYISGDLTITAIFRQKTWKLDLAVSPNLGAPLPAGSGYLPKNAQHTISVTPNAGYEFVEWRVDKGNVTVLGAGSTTDIKLGEPQDSQWNLTAIVKRIDPSINVLTLEADTGGSARAQLGFTMLTVPAGTSAEKAFTLGEGITLWATPSANYSFAGWEGPVAGTGAVASISLSGPTHVRAKFSPVPFNVSIARANANGGAEVGGSSVSGGNGTPGLDISVPTPGPDNANYPMGSVVTLTASPAGDYLFRKWQATQLGIPVTLPDNDVNPYSFTVGNRPLVITALFARLADIPLTLHADAGGSATATGTFSNPLNGNPLTVTVNAIENGSATGYYLENTPVTITANPSANFAFDKWTGDVSNAQAGSSPLSMTMSSAKTVTAGFKRVRSDLTVAISPAAAATAGARVINAAFPFANLTGVTNHPVNTTLSIRPVNATTTEAAWVFDHWEGDLSGTANPASISLPTDRTIIAVFRQQHVLTLKTNPAWKGSITVSTGTLSLDSSTGNNIWTGIYAEGTSVTITVIPYNSVAFSSWTGDTADIPPAQLAVNPLTITMDRSRTLIATITAATQIGLGVTPDYRETLTQTMSLPNTEADKIRISGNFSITAGNPAESKVFGYICAIPDNWPQTTNTAYVSKNDTISLSAPELVTDNNGVVWQFTAWGIGYWHPEPQSWGRNHTLNVADLGNDSPIPIRALYTDQRVLRPTVTLDGATTTAVSIKANSAVLTTGSEKKYTWNQTAALEAYSQTGVVFSSWGGEAQPDASDRTLAATTMNVDRSNVIASYKTAIPVTLDIVVEGGSAARPQFAPWLTATLPGEGTVPVGAYLPQTFQVGKGDTITFAVTDTIVTPVAGRYRFKGWDTDADGVVDQTGSSLSRVADAACTVKAVFVRTWTLETLVDPAVAGSITSTPSAAWYDHGTSVILTANNGTGYVFHHWSETSPGSFTGGYQDGATATDQITHITMVANQSLTAHYEFARNALSVNINVNGTLNPPAHTDNLPFTADGTPLTAPGSKMYNYGVNANITATVPAPGAAYRFDGWNPPASKGTNNPITVEMLGAQAITAHYKTRCLIAFSVETVGGGTGGAPSVTGHTAMDGNSWVSYYGDTVTLAANPASGYRFLRWEIDTDGDPATIEITDTRSPWSSAITTNWQVKAVYAKEYTLTFATNPADGSGGTVNKPASYIAYHGEKITNVIASPKIDYDWYFTKWTVSPDAMDLTEPVPSGIHDTDTNPVSFTVTDNHVITANFSRAGQERTLTLTIRLDGVDNPPGCLLTVLADGSSVAGHIDPTRIPAGGTKLYYRGDQPRLDATPANAAGDSLAADYEFVGWGDSASANPVRTLSAVLGDTPVTAIYRTKAVLYMQVQPPGVATTTPVPPDGTPYATWLGENITITATPTAEHIDDYAFEKWTALPVASPPNPVNHYNSVININARERTAIAHFKPGCRLEVKAQYETTPHPADPQTYGIATGTRTTAAAGAGNTAAIRSPYSGEPDSAIKTIIIDEGTGKASARIIATAASPTFRFVRWDIDDNNDGVIDRTLSASSGDIVMDSTIGRNVVAYAIFEKNTVTLTVHTSPDGIPETVDGTANTASTGSPINITAEPKIYRYFYGDTANLQAIDNSDGVYTFGGWYRGEGYSELAENLISSNLATSYGPLKSDAVVTAVFWVGGKYRIILFLDQTSEGRKVDIKNLSALGTFTLTYMKIDGRNACVVGFTDGLSSGALTPSAEAWVHRSDTNNNAAAAATTAAAATSLPPPPLSGWTSDDNMRETGPLPIDAAPTLIIPLRAAQSVTGWNSETGEPESRAFLWWEIERDEDRAKYDHLLIDRTKHDQAYFICPELDTMNPMNTPRIVARYEPPGGAAIKLMVKFVGESVDFIKSDAGAGWLYGTIHNNTTPTIMGDYLLYVTKAKHEDWTDKIPLGTQEEFVPDATFIAGPLKIVDWDYESDTRDGTHNRKTGLPSPDGFTIPDSLLSGQEQLVVANLDVETYKVTLLKPHFQVPSGWPQPVFAGTAGFNLGDMDYNHTGNRIDDYYKSVEISPVTDPATTLAEARSVRGASAPGLHVSSTSGNYIFAGWDTTGGTMPNLFVNAFSWAGGTATWPTGVWPATMTGDRQARPIYTIRHPLTLSITPVDATDKHFFYLEASPYGIEVSNAGGITTSETKSYAQGSQFTLKATSTDPGPYHVVKSWIIRKDVNGDGTYSQETVIVADNGADNLPGDKTYELTLDYPTKSEVVFGWQQFEIKLDVANSKDGARHGDVKLDGNLLTPRESLPLGKLVNYGTTLDIEALADTGYLFKGWTPVEDGPASPAQAATTVFVNKAKTLTAHFERKVTLILATDPADLPAQVISPEAGTWTELPAGTILTDGVIVSGIQALVGTGYDFTHWTIVDGNNPDPANPRTVDTATLGDLELYGDAEAKITATAHYVRLYDLTINAQGLDADGAEESKVQANPSLSIDNQPMVAIANSNPTVTGQYREYLEGETYAPPRTITLTPTAGAHYEFDHWEITQGGTPLILTPAAGTNTVTLPSFTGNTVATAFFKKKNYTLTVSAWKADNVPFPPGSDGNIASLLRTTTPVTQNFPLDGATGTLSVPYKSKVTLTTSPAPRFSFDKWTDSGANDLGSDPQTPAGYAFTLIGDRTLRAEFTREEFQLTTAVTPDNSYGTITSSVIRLTNPTWHIADTVLTLTAVPAVVSPGITSYLFSEWTTTRNNVAETPGAPASTTLELKMDADWTATARFVKAVRVKVDVSATSAAPGTPGGSITGITGYKHQDPDGYYVFAEGDPVTITAAANEHFTFSEWTGAPADAIRTDTGNPATRSKLEFTASADAEITAKFTAKTYTLTVTSDPAAAARTLVAHQPPAPDHNFLTDGADISRLYPTVLSLETTPAGANNGDPSPHYRFISWREGASMLNTSPTLPFTFNRNADIQAFFIRQVIVTMNPVLDITRATEISGTGGTVSLPVGDHRKDVPDTIIITATPGVGYEFAEWRGLPAGATVDPVTGTLTLPLTETTGDLELTPCFRLVFHKVTISTWDKYTSVANVSGSVMISPDPEPNGRYYYGTKVTVTLRQTYYGYRFLGWDANGDRDPEVTVFNDPVTCSATFTVTDTMEIVGIFHRTFRLSMNTDPTSGSGTAAITSPPPISQVTPGTWVFDAGTRVNLLAEPVVPAEFIGWAGDVDNPDAETTSVMMTADRSITARFGVQIRRNLTVNVTPATHGTVLIDDSLIVGGACPPTATKSYIHGQEADLKATALAGYEFAGWTGDPVIGSAAVTHARVAMTAARALTANFRIVRHELTVRALPDGSGTVTGGGFYDNNQTATLTASPASGYTFRGWDTDGNGTPDETSTTLSVVVTGDRTIDALFRKIGENATLTVQVSPSGSASYSILDGDVPNEKIIRVSPAASYTWPEHLAWSGPDSGLLYGHSLDEDTGVLEARIYLTSDRSVAISLVPIAVTLTVEAVPSDKGVVTIDPPGGSYTKGSKVTVDAIATDPGFIFKHWEGPVTSDSSVLRVTLDTSMKLVAIFEMKPKTYQVTLGFDSMSVDHDNDQVELRSTGSLLFKDRNSQQLSGFFLEGSELTIRCLLEDYLNYGFSSWTGVPNENVQYTDPDSQGNVTSHLLVTQGMTVNALVQVENPLLRTYATCEADDSQNKDPCVSVGGTVTPGGFCSIGDRMLIWAVPNPGWMVIPGPPPLATSGWGSSYISAEQPDPTGQPEGAVGFYVIIGAKVTDVPVPFVPDGYVPPKVSISGGSHELDNPDTRAPRHHIYGTPLSP